MDTDRSLQQLQQTFIKRRDQPRIYTDVSPKILLISTLLPRLTFDQRDDLRHERVELLGGKSLARQQGEQ
jgi:hypothetical protein